MSWVADPLGTHDLTLSVDSLPGNTPYELHADSAEAAQLASVRYAESRVQTLLSEEVDRVRGKRSVNGVTRSGR